MKTKGELRLRSKAKNEGSVESEILESLGNFTDALEKGEVTKRYTCRQITLDLEPTLYDPDLVRKTRGLLGVSQTLFARFLGVSPKTVKSWEQGFNSPHTIACRFMDEIRRTPQFWQDRLKAMSVSRQANKKDAAR